MADIYRIGVSIALANGVSPVLGVIARDMMGLNTKVGAVEAGLSRWKLAIGGAVAMLGGAAMLGVMGKLVSKGAELTHQQQRMAASGMTQVEQARAIAKAWELTAKYRSVGVKTIGDIILDTMPAYGSAREATNLAGIATRATVVLNGILPEGKGGDAVEQMFAGVKAAELRNIALDPKAVETFFNDMVKVAAVSNGKVMPKDFFSFVKYTRTNAPYLSERFLSGVAPTLIQELGPSGAGNAVTTLGQTVIGGRMTKRAAGAMEELGLLDPRNVGKGSGMGVYIKQGGVKGWETGSRDPYEWAQTVLLPALVAHGFKDPIQQRLEFGKLFGARMAETMANILVTQAPRIEKDRNLYARAPGLATAETLQASDFQTNVKAMHEQWNNMLMAIGKPLVGPAVNAIKSMTSLFTAVGQFATAHPGATKLIGETVVALGAALVVGGAVAIGAAAIIAVGAAGEVAAITAGCAAVVGALGTLAAFNWDSLKGVAKAITGWIPRVGGSPLPTHPQPHGSAPGGAKPPAAHGGSVDPAAAVMNARRAYEARMLANQTAQFKYAWDSMVADGNAIGAVGVDVFKNMAAQLQPVWNWIGTGFSNWVAQLKSDWETLGGIAHWLGFGKAPATPKIPTAPQVWTAPQHPAISSAQFEKGLRLEAQTMGLLPWDTAALKALSGAAGASRSALADQRGALVDATQSTRTLQAAQLAFAGQLKTAAASVQSAMVTLSAANAKPIIPPRPSSPTHKIVVPVNLDGRKIAEVVSQHQAAGLTGPHSLSHGFDPSAALAGANAGYSR